MSAAGTWQPVGTVHPADSFAAGMVDAWRLVAARGAPAVRALIARYAGQDPGTLALVAGRHGKPQVAVGPLRFNLSHSGGTTLLAFALDVEVGIDVEHARVLRRREALLARCFTPAEQATLRVAPDPDAALLAAWTAKEALVKAVGRGLAYGLGRVELGLGDAFPALRSLSGPAGPAACWRLRELPPVPGAAAALAHADAALALRCFST